MAVVSTMHLFRQVQGLLLQALLCCRVKGKTKLGAEAKAPQDADRVISKHGIRGHAHQASLEILPASKQVDVGRRTAQQKVPELTAGFAA